MKIIYVAGPYSAPTREDIQANIFRARVAAEKIATIGAVPLTPHLNTAHMDHLRDRAWWLEATLALMHVCDAVYLLYGWQDSEGARGEEREARQAGIPCFESLEQLEGWVHA